MKHLAEFVQILPLSDFESFDGTSLISKSGVNPDTIIANNNLLFSTRPETSAAGPFFTEQLQIATDKLAASQRKVYFNRMPVIVLLFTDVNEPVVWGDLDQKVRISITPNTDYDVIDLVRKTTKSLF